MGGFARRVAKGRGKQQQLPEKSGIYIKKVEHNFMIKWLLRSYPDAN